MNIKPRSAWGAKPPTRPGEPWADHGPIDLVVHWVGGSGSLFLSDPARVPQAIRAIQAAEMAGPYSDIAYNLVLDPWGQLWEGRTLAVRGAANGPETNGTKPSVCLLLNQGDTMTQPMKETIKAMRVNLTPGQLYGHREVNTTACPGNEVMAWISDQRQPRPPTPPPPAKMELDPMYLMRGDKTPHVWIVSGGTKRHLDAASYPSWLVWSLVHIPGACDPMTNKEWVVPQIMVDALKDLV